MSAPSHIRLCRAILLCCFLFVAIAQCYAQTPHVYSFSELTGFEPKTIHGLLEDRDGQIWISAEQGLYQYDGATFKKYTHPDYSFEVGELHEDRDGRIWCNNFTGQVFYIEKDSVHLFKDLSEYVIDHAYITSIDFPRIYVTTFSYGYLEMDFYSKEVKTGNYRIDKDSPYNRITEKGDTLFNEAIRAYKLFPQKLHLYRPPYLLEINTNTRDTTLLATLQPDWNFLSRPTIYKRGEKLLIAMTDHQKGLLLEYGEEGIQKVPLPYGSIGGFHANALLIEENEKLWLPTLDGLVALNKRYELIYGRQKILSGKTVTQVIRDKEGNYWIATKNNGVFIMSSVDIVGWNAENSALLTDEIKAIEQDKKGNIYLGQADRNLFRLPAGDRKPEYLATMDNECENMLYDPHRNCIWWAHTPAYYDINRKQVVSLPNLIWFSKDFSFIDPANVIGSQSAYAQIVNFSEPAGKYPPMDSLWRNSDFEYNISIDERGRIDYPFHQIILRRKRSMDNEYDPVNNTIWVSYVDGLYRYKNAKEKEIRWRGKSILPTTLLTAAKGGVWLSTLQNQLLKVADNGDVTLKKDSLPASIIEIKQWEQYLFLASKQGIYRLNTENNNLELFNHLDGLPSNDVNDLEVVNDTVYAATMGGLAIFPAGLSAINTVPPEIAISGFSVNEKARLLQNRYDLPFTDNNLNITFRARAVRSQSTFQYQYRMLGIDSSWISVDSHINFARYPSLPSGDYTFEVKSVNEDGIASVQPARLQLSIATPYYRTWWFFTLIALGALGIFGTFFGLRLQAVRKEQRVQKVEKELAESQLSALRSQMNPHFIFNALNSIQSYIMSEDKALAGAYLSRFSELMRLYLHHSNTDTLKLSEEIDALERYLGLEKIRFEDDLVYTIDIDKEMIPEDISIPSMLVQPFVENALKHGLLHKKGEKKLRIIFTRKAPRQLLCIIEDNGIGRKRSAEINKHKRKIHKSFATSAIENRLKLLNQGSIQKIEANTIDLYDENNQACGTRVELYITL